MAENNPFGTRGYVHRIQCILQKTTGKSSQLISEIIRIRAGWYTKSVNQSLPTPSRLRFGDIKTFGNTTYELIQSRIERSFRVGMLILPGHSTCLQGLRQ